mgnify:CR=1 FL=1
MSGDLLGLIKQAAVEAVNAGSPMGLLFGKVTSIDPLTVQVNQKLILTEEFLVLTYAVKDHYRDMTVNHMTENASGGSGDAAYAAHNHHYVGRKQFLIHNDLQVGEHVALLKAQGGQQYLILDRVVM